MKNLKRNKDDTANEDLSVQKQKPLFRNQLFDIFVDTEDFFFAALRIDDKKNKLFCGQVCEITDSFEKNGLNCFLVVFTDFLNGEEILECFIEKKHLLPLFDFNPKLYKEETQNARTEWEKYEVHNISTLQIKPHKKVENRFEIGQLVTLQLDFEQNCDDNTKIDIQAGQVGVISKILDDANVEVTFRSIALGTLAQVVQVPELENFRVTDWEKKIHICKDFLFPLYCEALK
jgi:hypothetical protein